MAVRFLCLEKEEKTGINYNFTRCCIQKKAFDSDGII